VGFRAYTIMATQVGAFLERATVTVNALHTSGIHLQEFLFFSFSS